MTENITDRQKLARPELTEIISTMVKNERVRQDVKYGIQSHSDGSWQLFLNKQLGDFSNAKIKRAPEEEQLKSLVQAAAVLIAWAEDKYDHIEQTKRQRRDETNAKNGLLSSHDNITKST